MSLQDVLDHYGYLAIFIGTFLEGETILVLGGFAAHRGYLDLAAVVAAAFAGTLFGDQLYFFLGRRQGAAMLARRPHWEPRVARVRGLMRRHEIALILGFRFLYGLRTVTPLALGMSGIRPLRFALLNVPAAFGWAIAIGVLGYELGSAFQGLLGDLKRFEGALFAAIAAAGAALWLVSWIRRRRAVNA
jgi:membrane protein DedA with SNARE-associated domain